MAPKYLIGGHPGRVCVYVTGFQSDLNSSKDTSGSNFY
jgi:hypothetical protein